MNSFLTYAGKSTLEMGVLISGEGTYNAPERNVEEKEVAGRNGKLLFDMGNFKNILVNYPAYIRQDLPDRSSELFNYLASFEGYQRLEDTYHPYEYRMARYLSNVEVSPDGCRNRSGGFTLSFDCKPQRFLKSGNEPVTYTANGKIFNRTLYPAKPFLKIYGTGEGTVGIGSETIIISAISTYMEIDCEIMDAYKGAINCNGNVSFTDDIIIRPGEVGVSMTGNISRVDITPRWWII